MEHDEEVRKSGPMNLTREDVAEILGIPKISVQRAINRFREKLRRRLERENYG